MQPYTDLSEHGMVVVVYVQTDWTTSLTV